MEPDDHGEEEYQKNRDCSDICSLPGRVLSPGVFVGADTLGLWLRPCSLRRRPLVSAEKNAVPKVWRADWTGHSPVIWGRAEVVVVGSPTLKELRAVRL